MPGFGSIMVLVPHQDDEIIMCAGVIEAAVRAKTLVTVVMATNGDCGADSPAIGQTRLAETLEGLALLGVSSEDVIFMGYADTGMSARRSFLTRLYNAADKDALYLSHCSAHTYGLPDKQDWHTERFGQPAEYTRASIMGDLCSILREIRPDNIFVTSPDDFHGDHSALYNLMKEALSMTEGYDPVIYKGLVHPVSGDDYWPLREDGGRFTEPVGFAGDWDSRVCFDTPDPSLKKAALSKHKTALKPDAVEFLYSFVKSDEVFIRERAGERQ